MARLSGKRIENDEQLQKSLDWLLEKAKKMEHPLMSEEAKVELMVKYDFVTERVLEYRSEQTILNFPYLQQIDGTVLAPVDEEPEVKTEPKAAPQSVKPINLSAWMDD